MATFGREILRLPVDEPIKIEPFNMEQVGPASIDLRLGNTFRVFEKNRDIFHIREDADYKHITRTVKVEEGNYFLTMPNELVQGITRENISLPPTGRRSPQEWP